MRVDTTQSGKGNTQVTIRRMSTEGDTTPARPPALPYFDHGQAQRAPTSEPITPARPGIQVLGPEPQALTRPLGSRPGPRTPSPVSRSPARPRPQPLSATWPRDRSPEAPLPGGPRWWPTCFMKSAARDRGAAGSGLPRGRACHAARGPGPRRQFCGRGRARRQLWARGPEQRAIAGGSGQAEG